MDQSTTQIDLSDLSAHISREFSRLKAIKYAFSCNDSHVQEKPKCEKSKRHFAISVQEVGFLYHGHTLNRQMCRT